MAVVLAVLAIVIPSVATLVGSYWQVRATRSRTDTSLQSPQSKMATRRRPASRFRKGIDVLFQFAIPVGYLAYELTRRTPVSRADIFSICLMTTLIIANVLARVVFSISNGNLDLFRKIVEIIETMTGKSKQN